MKKLVRRMQILVTQDEFDALRTISFYGNTSMNQLIRTAIKKEIKRIGKGKHEAA